MLKGDNCSDEEEEKVLTQSEESNPSSNGDVYDDEDVDDDGCSSETGNSEIPSAFSIRALVNGGITAMNALFWPPNPNMEGNRAGNEGVSGGSESRDIYDTERNSVDGGMDCASPLIPTATNEVGRFNFGDCEARQRKGWVR
ncbi:hypothetical protein HDU76_013273 [Blyttiomyces sp. JEL0837]|nr:hypothetical protein HDU76_013273 [Blyttiomyces sp. JEL0837]